MSDLNLEDGEIPDDQQFQLPAKPSQSDLYPATQQRGSHRNRASPGRPSFSQRPAHNFKRSRSNSQSTDKVAKFSEDILPPKLPFSNPKRSFKSTREHPLSKKQLSPENVNNQAANFAHPSPSASQNQQYQQFLGRNSAPNQMFFDQTIPLPNVPQTFINQNMFQPSNILPGPSFNPYSSFPVQRTDPLPQFTQLASITIIPQEMQLLSLLQFPDQLMETKHTVKAMLLCGVTVPQLVSLGLSLEVINVCLAPDIPVAFQPDHAAFQQPTLNPLTHAACTSVIRENVPNELPHPSARITEVMSDIASEHEEPAPMKSGNKLRQEDRIELGTSSEVITPPKSTEDQGQSDDDMELDENDDTPIIIEGTWKTVSSPPKESDNLRSIAFETQFASLPQRQSRTKGRPSAADLNNRSLTYNYGTQKKFVTERKTSYVIEVSDSSDDDEGENDRRSSSSKDFLRDDKLPSSVKMKMLELEIKKKQLMHLISKKSKKVGSSKSESIEDLSDESSLEGNTKKKELIAKSKLTGLESRKAALLTSIADLKSQLTTSEEENDIHQNAIKKLKGENSILLSSISEDEQKILELSRILNALETGLNEKKNAAKELERQIENETVEATKSIQNMLRLKDDMSSANSEFLNIEKEIKLELENMSLQDASKSTNDARKRKRDPVARNDDFITLPPDDEDVPMAEIKSDKEMVDEIFRELEDSFSSTIPLLELNGFNTLEKDIAFPSDLFKSRLISASEMYCSTKDKTNLGGFTYLEGSAGVPYESFLSRFKSYRLNPVYGEKVKSGYRSVTYSNKIDPKVGFCLTEIMSGICKDKSCKYQHFSAIQMTPEEIVTDMMEYSTIGVKTARKESSSTVSGIGDPLERTGSLIAIQKWKSNAELTPLIKTSKAKVIQTSADSSPINPAQTAIPTTKYLDQRIQFPNRQPILVKGLLDLVNGDEPQGKPKYSRYYEATVSEEQYEVLVSKEPQNEVIWLNYAIETIPQGLSVETLEKVSGNLNKTIKILARALQRNRGSEAIWDMYLEIYSRRGTEHDVREVFEQALRFIPGCPKIWWRYYIWEKEKDVREKILLRMIEYFAGSSGEKLDTEQRSILLLNAAIQKSILYIEDAEISLASAWLHHFLTRQDHNVLVEFDSASAQTPANFLNASPQLTKTVAYALLSKNDLALGWLLLFELLYHGKFPQSAQNKYPNEWLLRNDLFVIDWNVVPKPAFPINSPDSQNGSVNSSTDEMESVNHDRTLLRGLDNTMRQILTSWRLLVNQYTKAPYIALLETYISFSIKFKGKDQPLECSTTVEDDLKVFIGKSIQAHPDLPELSDFARKLDEITGDVEMSANQLKEFLVRIPLNFAMWNRLAKIAIKQNSVPQAILVLINCIRTCFVGLEEITDPQPADLNQYVDDALIHYNIALGLYLPSLLIPEFQPDISRSQIKSNIFVWLNFAMLQALAQVNKKKTDELSEVLQRDLDFIFTNALEAIKDPQLRILIHCELVRIESFKQHSNMLEKSDAIFSLFTHGVKELEFIPEVHPFRLQNLTIEAVEYLDMVPTMDLRMIRQLVKETLDSVENKASILKRIVKYQEKILSLHVVRSLYSESLHVYDGRIALFELLKSYPKFGDYWRLATRIESFSEPFGNLSIADWILKYAQKMCPNFSFRGQQDGLKELNTTTETIGDDNA